MDSTGKTLQYIAQNEAWMKARIQELERQILEYQLREAQRYIIDSQARELNSRKK